MLIVGCGGSGHGSAPPLPSEVAPVAEPSATATTAPRRLALDTAPAPQPPEVVRRLAAPPPSVFPSWDGKATVIYDVQTGKALDLGPGSQPASFSPDESMAVWAAGGDFANGTEAFLVDLRTGIRRSLGPGRYALFLQDGNVGITPPGQNDRVVVDPVTGSRKPDQGAQPVPFVPAPPSAPPGYVVEPSGLTSPEVRVFTVRTASGAALFTLDAVGVKAAGPGEIAVAAPPVDGRSAVYVVDIASGAARVVATAVIGRGNWPFSASAGAILWTDGFCTVPMGFVSYYDRARGQIVRLDTSAIEDPSIIGGEESTRWAFLTPSGLLAAGSFGPKYLIDPVTLGYVAVVPSGPRGWGGDVSWSSGYRYASRGVWGGHGGLCGG